MKKIIAIALTMVLLLSAFCMVAQAKVGDVVGQALHTDIVVYINNFAIPSYAVNGQSVIVAEDLRNFGFDVTWDNRNRSLTITRNSDFYMTNPMHVSKGYTTGSKYTNILATDIRVYANGVRLTSYAMNGYTMIPVEELTMFGEVNWVQNERALKMWIDGFEMNAEKQVVSYQTYPGTSAPDYGWITGDVCLLWKDVYGSEYERFYSSNASKMQEYVNYIKRNGWYLEQNLQDEHGIWYAAYINKKLRTGINIAEVNGMVYVQVKTPLDYWMAGFDE